MISGGLKASKRTEMVSEMQFLELGISCTLWKKLLLWFHQQTSKFDENIPKLSSNFPQRKPFCNNRLECQSLIGCKKTVSHEGQILIGYWKAISHGAYKGKILLVLKMYHILCISLITRMPFSQRPTSCLLIESQTLTVWPWSDLDFETTLT